MDASITDPTIATLVATIRSLKATMDRINVVASPNAWDLAEAAHKDNVRELRKRLVRRLPATTGWRRVVLSDGSIVEAFNHGAGVSFAHRVAPGTPGASTLRCRTAINESEPLWLLQQAVLADLGIAA